MTLRDITIRGPLESWLWIAHRGDQGTRLLHELKMPRPSARIDLAVINGELCGFEIKSDVDSLARLDRQQRAFSSVFDRVTVVTTDKHTEKAERLIPCWWGLLIAKRQCNKIILEEIRPPRTNPSIDLFSLVHLLSCQELKFCLSNIGWIDKCKPVRRDLLIAEIINLGSASDIKSSVRFALKVRTKNATLHLHTPQKL